MSKKRLVAVLAAAAMLASSSAALAAGEPELIGADTAAVVSVAEDAAPDVAEDAVQETAVEDEAAVLAEDGTGINWTASSIEISNIEELKAFRDTVNSGRSFSGQTIKLTSDIDLNGENWTPIGTSTMFSGVFDGQNHTISNCKIIGYELYGDGFFLNTSGTTIKNVTFEKIKVEHSTYHTYMNVCGIVCAYAYGSSTFDNIHVKDSSINGFGKVGTILGMAADPGSFITTITNCSAENVTIYAVYDVGGIAGLIQNQANISGCTTANIEWIPNEADVYEYLDTYVTCDGSADTCAGANTKIKGTYWLDSDGYYWGGYADLYVKYGDSSHDCTIAGKDGCLLANSEVVHDAAAKLGDTKYQTYKDVFSIAQIGDVIECISEPTNEDLKYLEAGVSAIRNGNTITLLYANDILDNANATNDEKVAAINSTAYDEDAAQKALDTIKTLPTEYKEQIEPSKVAEIVEKTSEADIVNDTDESITAKAVKTNGIETLSVTKKNDDETSLKQPDGVNAVYFDVTLSDENGNPITKTDVPVYIEINVGEGKASQVNNVLREHDGVVSSLPFSQVNNSTIAISSAKFSDFVVVMNQDIAAGSAVLGFYEDKSNTDDNTAVFDMYLTANEDETLKKFESGEFKFIKTGTSGAEFTPADNLTIEYNEESGLYKVFRKDGSVTYPSIETKGSMQAIKLGTVTLTGIGSGSITTDKIKMYRHSIDGENLAVAIPTSPMATVSYEIKPSYTDLTVEVSYPNNITNNETAYQDMKITVAGADFSETYKLGTDASGNVSFANNAYTLKISDKLIKNTAYTVTVEGAGYRTARYTVNMTGNKTLKFWNNVLDNAQAIEYDENGAAVTGARTTKTTFLAGDIVADGKINLYDLSAVVSYFGTTGLNASNYPQYAKYDLNRDGKIDSKDIAYVLVSWGE